LHFLYGHGYWIFFFFWSFVFLLFRTVCSVHLPIYSTSCWFFEGLVFISLYVLVINPLSDIELAKIFSHWENGDPSVQSFLCINLCVQAGIFLLKLSISFLSSLILAF
jgi:hypothetical protein